MKFNKMMVALDQSKMDEILIHYSKFICGTFGLKSICFIHVVADSSSPENLIYSYENIIEKDPLILEKRRKKLENKIKPVFDILKGIDLNISTIEGNPEKQIFQKIQDEDIDLLIVGKKQLSGGSGFNARRVAQKSKSAVWFITEKATIEIKRILVPVDFSENSLRALIAARHLKAKLKEVNIIALHVIHVPFTSLKINKNRNVIITNLKASAKEEFHRFMDQNEINISNLEFQSCMNDEFDVSIQIRQKAAQENCDLIIIGGKGHSRVEDFLFGSVTEKLVSFKHSTPILVIR